MARQEIIISVFVASPSDLEEERSILETVIGEHNKTWARNFGIRFELINWETHAYPSFGEDPQAVINEQIPQDFDLFIGLMWHRFGTPTGRAGSGTIEEFQRAKERHDADPDSLQLMVYFKDAPIPVSPSQLDFSQIESVAAFRSTLGEQGGLYWSFQAVDEFERLVRVHLARFVQDWQSQANKLQSGPTTSVQKENTPHDSSFDHDEEDEIGLLDLAEQFEDDFSKLTEITKRIENTTVELGEKIKSRTSEIDRFAGGSNSPNRKVVKRLLKNVASDMDQYVHRMEAEMPLFGQLLNSGTNTLSQIAVLFVEFSTDRKNAEQIEGNLDDIREFLLSMKSAKNSLAEFKDSVVSIPRMTTILNRSKREMAKVIQQLIDELHSAESITQEAETILVSFLETNDSCRPGTAPPRPAPPGSRGRR